MIRYFCAIIFCLVITSSASFGAIGDVIVEDLHETTSLNDWGARSIVSYGGAPGGSGVAAVVNATTGDATAYWGYDMPANTSEVTIIWWERFNVWPLEWTYGGVKSIRPYHGGTDDYVNSIVNFHGDDGISIYMSRCVNATVDINRDVVTDVIVGDPYAAFIGGDTYKMQDKYWKHCWEGMGTEWRKMRLWIKMPTTFGGEDGESEFWIDDILHYHAYDWKTTQSQTATQYLTHIRFAPVDETGTPHEHWYDEITIYEGYVPPDGTPLPTYPDPDPAPTTTGPILRTGTHLLRVGDSVLRVR